jgi:hypothetical protein
MIRLADLPPGLREQMQWLDRRLHRLRFVRGMSLLLLVLLLGGAAAMACDAWLELPGLVRSIFFLLWLLLGIGVALAALIVPTIRRLDPKALAALVELHFPELAECLTTTVELAGSVGPESGSAAFIAALEAQTAARSRTLNFNRAAPARRSVRLAGLTGAVLLGALAPALFWPERATTLGKRFLVPWPAPAMADEPSASVLTEANSPATSPPAAEDAVIITISPPEYARASVPSQTLSSIADLWVLQHSRAAFAFHFARARTGSGWLEWSPTSAQSAQRIPIRFASDGSSGHAELTPATSGVYRLLLDGEPTNLSRDRQAVTVQPDQPPVFSKVSGTSRKVLEPSDSLALTFALTDDIGLHDAALEYSINQGPGSRVPAVLKSANATSATGQVTLNLTGQLKAGDEVRYRLRATDNRNVPAAGLGPNVRTYPSHEWLTLQVGRPGEPLLKQEIAARHEAMKKRLEKLKEGIGREQADLAKLRPELRDETAINPKEAKQLDQLAQESRGLGDAMHELAQEAAEVPGLGTLASLAEEVADRDLGHAAEALEAGEQDDQPQRRDHQLQAAEQDLAAAVRNLEEMAAANDRQARAENDKAELADLAERQRQLAQKAAKEAGGDAAKTQKQELQQEQNKLAEELKHLTEESEALRAAVDEARRKEAHELADKIRALAKEQRELAQNRSIAGQPADRSQPSPLAQEKELFKEANQLAGELDQSAANLKTRPGKTKAAQAAEDLKHGAMDMAQEHQAESAQELKKLADQLGEKGANDARAERLARQQGEAAAETDRRLERRPQTPERAEAPPIQRQLAAELEDVFAGEKAQVQKQRAQRALAWAQQPAPLPLRARMQWEAADALQNLADALAGRNDPASQAAELAREQRNLANEAAREPKPNEEPPIAASAAADREGDLLHRLNRLQTPAAEDLREQARQAMRTAHAALKKGQSAALTAESLKAAALAVDTLAQQLARDAGAGAAGPSAQAKAEDLAKQQRQLTDAVRQEASRPEGPERDEALQKLAARQEALAKQEDELVAAQAEQRLAQAEEAMTQGRTQMALALDLEFHSQTGRAAVAEQQAARSLERAAEAMDEASRQQADDPEEKQAAEDAKANDPGGKKQQPADDGNSDEGEPRQKGQGDKDKPHEDKPPLGQPIDDGKPDDGGTGSKTGKEVMASKSAMNDAQGFLVLGQSEKAEQAMQKAADGLQRAADQLGKQSKKGGSGKKVETARGLDGRPVGPLAQGTIGRRWGELPGELRTKVLQDSQDKYGDDYARIIKLYFEQLAQQPRR